MRELYPLVETTPVLCKTKQRCSHSRKHRRSERQVGGNSRCVAQQHQSNPELWTPLVGLLLAQPPTNLWAKCDAITMIGGNLSMLPEMSAVFEPEELSLLGSIFDQAVAALPATMQTQTNRTEIAKIILERAAAGELHLTDLMKFFVAVSPSRSVAVSSGRIRLTPTANASTINARTPCSRREPAALM